MSAEFKELSKKQYTIERLPSTEDIQTGCLQRIADATELMAKSHTQLVEERDRLKRRHQEQIDRNQELRKTIIYQKATITKLKNKLKIQSRVFVTE